MQLFLICFNIGDSGSEENVRIEHHRDLENLASLADYTLGSPIYEGSNETVRDVINKYLNIFIEKHLSKAALSEILYATKTTLPSPNLLPDSYQRMRSLISHELIQIRKTHACINDCILFQGVHERLEQCPKCGADRYKSVDALGRKYSHRTYSYCSLKEHLEKLFGCSNIAQVIQSLGGGTLIVQNIVCDMTDTNMWAEWTENNGDNSSKVILGLNTDGVNPYSSQGIKYSLWPLILVIMNIPKHHRNKDHAMILAGVVPSRKPRQHGGGLEPNLDPYVNVIVDELIKLSSSEIYSAHSGAPINVKVRLLVFMFDFQGYSKFFHMSGANAYLPCNVCLMRARQMKTSGNFKKMVLIGHGEEFATRSYAAEVRTALF